VVAYDGFIDLRAIFRRNQYGRTRMSIVSVIIPTLNRPKLLIRSVISALQQTLKDLEVIVVIDGPNSESSAELGKLSDPRIRLINNVVSLGPAGARNAGAAAATGAWIAFLDDDDEWHTCKLERQLAFAGSSDQPIIVSCLSEVRTQNARLIWPRRIYDNSIALADYLFDRRSLLKGDTMIQTSSLMLPRALFEALKFRWQHDDWDLLLRAVMSERARIVTVPEALVILHQDELRSAVSAEFPWRSSLDWIEQIRSHISPRAYSGFCLTVIAPQAASKADYSAFVLLPRLAFRKGRPRLTHIALYLWYWLVKPLPALLRRLTGVESRK
jgi:glycosyltransferase involved in cell wall biosynthesis